MNPEQEKKPTVGRKIAIIGIVLLLFGAAALILTVPWFIDGRLGGAAVNTYDPIAPGRHALFIVTDSSGNQTGWESHATDELSLTLMINFITDEHYRSGSLLFGFDPAGDQFRLNFNADTLQFKGRDKRAIDTNGNQRFWLGDIFIQSEYGEHLYFDFDPARFLFGVNSPPVQTWPAKIDPDQQPLRGQSEFPSAQQSYTSSLDVKQIGGYQIGKTRFTDCAAVDFALDRDSDSQESKSHRLKQVFCEGIGLVEEQRFDENGSLIETLALFSTNETDLATNPILTFPIQPVAPADLNAEADASAWQITPIIELTSSGFKSQPSQPLTLLPFPKPLLMTARTSDEALMYDAETAVYVSGVKTKNAIYGTPAVNPANGLIYFGSSDKRLYAVSHLGMFVDSISTNDSVVTRPVFGPDSVWFASEDGKIYCATADLDPAKLTTHDLAAPIASSPVAWQNSAIFGGDGGDVVAVDKHCNELWRYAAGDPIDAPLAIDENGVVYFAGHGQIGALDATTGAALWLNEPDESLHNQPAVLNDNVFVTDIFNQLHAYSRTTGQLLWTKADVSYFGSVQVLAGQLLVNSADEVLLLDENGTRLASWSLAAAQAAFNENSPNFAIEFPESEMIFSPVLGTSKFWVIDDAGFIYQIAPPANASDPTNE